MAGRNRTLKAVGTSPANQRTRKKRATRSRAYGELMELVAKQGARGVGPGLSSADVLQECLNRAVGGMRYAASEVDKLLPEDFWVRKIDAQGNVLVEPNKWYQLETECRGEVERLAGLMEQLGIAERAVQVEEARAALVVSAIRDAAREAGIKGEQLRRLGSGLRDRLEAGPVAA